MSIYKLEVNIIFYKLKLYIKNKKWISLINKKRIYNLYDYGNNFYNE